MIAWLMVGGIGFLAGCLLNLALIPLVHHRAVRLTTKSVLDAVPFAVEEIQALKDHLRAQFALSARRLEVNLEEMQTKVMNQSAEIGRQRTEIRNLKLELEKRAALISVFRVRWHVRQSIIKRTVKLLLYPLARSNRRWLRTVKTRPVPVLVDPATVSAVGQEAA
jgi:hypothetical protein